MVDLPPPPAEVRRAADLIQGNREYYIALEKATGICWRLLGAIHYREANCRADRSIQDGHKLKEGEDQASFIMAWMKSSKLSAPRTLGEKLNFAERWNGLGYRKRGVPSPYVWSMTARYVKGKYTSDGVYDPEKVDRQAGIAAVLEELSRRAQGDQNE